MKYGTLILIGVVIALYLTHLYLTKREPVKTIDKIICKEMHSYGEDIETGEKYLVVRNECDTIYEK